MGVKVTNNAFGTISAGISSTDTTITLDSGQGARFPTLGAGDYFYGTLVDTSNTTEIVKVTARSTDSMTVVRGQDNTTASAFAIGDRFELRPTAALFEALGTDGITSSATGTAMTIDSSNDIDFSGEVTLNGDAIVPQGNYISLRATGGNINLGTGYDHSGSSGYNGYAAFWDADGTEKDCLFAIHPTAIAWGPVEGGTAVVRNLITFDKTNNASYPIFTNRTPSGKIALASSDASGGTDVERIVIHGGAGDYMGSRDIQLKNADIISGGHYIYRHHNCTQTGSTGNGGVGVNSDCGDTVSTDGDVGGCSQGTGHAYNWFNVKGYCEKAGMRLCTRDEIKADAARGTGCSHDDRAIWTSTRDSTGKYYRVQGNWNQSAGNHNEEAAYPHSGATPSGFATNEIGIRCCGQNDWA